MADSHLLTLGSFMLRIGAVATTPPSTQKARAILAYLVLHGGREVARDRLCELFWPEGDPERARHSLKTATWSIRRAIRLAAFDPDEFLRVGRATMLWLAPTTADANEFLQLATAAETSSHERALSLYRGPFLEGDYDDWVVAQREAIESAYESLLSKSLLSKRDPETARRLLERNPYCEEAYSVLIESEISAGRPLAARAFVERARSAMRELDISTSDAFETRFGRIKMELGGQNPPQLPFVGRDREMSEIARRIHDAANRRGGLLLLHGNAGMGKSSILNCARRLASESNSQIIDVNPSRGDVRTFGPWGDVLLSLTAVPIEDTVRAAGNEVARHVARQIVAAVPAGSLIVVDDAHTLGGESLAIFNQVALSASRQGAFVLCATRPEGRELAATFLDCDEFSELFVGPLSNDEVVAALQQALGSGARALADALYKRAGGHPLFINGLLHGLWREGVLSREGAQWSLGEVPNGAWPLPRDLARAIELRLCARGPVAKSVACALALDSDADSATVAAVLNLSEDRVLDAIDDLLALDIVRQPLVGPELAFSHDLIAEVAATALHSGRRRRMHSTFATQLAGRTEPSAAARRANHLYLAGLHLEAARAFAQASSAALEWYAWRNALELAQRGVHLAKSFDGTPVGDALLAELKMLVARSLAIGGNDEAALAPAIHAVTHARSSGSTQIGAQALAVAASAFLNCHRINEARRHAEEAAQLACGVDDLFATHTLMIVSSAHCHEGHRVQALDAASAALETAHRCGQAHVIAAAADALVRAQITWWKYGDALRSTEVGFSAAARAGWLAEGAFQVTRGALWHYLERFDQALRAYEDALRILEDEAGERRWQAPLTGIDRLKVRYFARYLTGVALCALERYDEAILIAEVLNGEPLAQTSHMICNNVLNLEIDALLGRNTFGDASRAEQLAAMLVQDPYEQGSILDFSTCYALTQARVAARLRLPQAGNALKKACRAVDSHAARTPLECDRAYAQLALAAGEAGETAIEEAARHSYTIHRAARCVAFEAASAAF